MNPGIIALASALTELAIAGVTIAPILSGAKSTLSKADYTELTRGIKNAHRRFDTAVAKRQKELNTKPSR